MVRLFLNDILSCKRLGHTYIYICVPLLMHRCMSPGDTFFLHHFNWIYKYIVVDYLYGVYFCRRQFTFKRYKNAK